MSNDLMIPDQSTVPAYLKNPELARKANEEAASGISTGYPARVKLSGKQFTLVDGNGDETPFPPASLVAGPDGNVYLPVIVLRAKKALSKSWYAMAYNPNSDVFQAPDCYSEDSERPDASASAPQSDTCAACPQNAFGSGKDQNGAPTKGKSCADTKILAVHVPGFGVHMLRIPPASLKNFGLFVKQLSANGIPLGTVKTLIGFDLAESYPIMVFKFGGYLPENLIPKLAEMSESIEVCEIVEARTAPAVAKQVAAPATVREAPEVKDAIEVKQPVVAELVDDDMGLGRGTPPKQAKPRTPKPKETTRANLSPDAPAPSAGAAEISDEQLMKELGL
jgi:hypothetical protein